MNHYSQELHNFVLERKPAMVVETGVQTGESTRAIISAMDETGHGLLVSIDPGPIFTEPHKRWTLIRKHSYECLPDVFEKFGAFDFFLHDSDHAVGCMVYELNMAVGCVNDRGIIACDDYDWGIHKAWQSMIDENGWSPVKLGAAEYVIKIGACTKDIKTLHEESIRKANAACARMGLGRYLPMRSGYKVDVG